MDQRILVNAYEYVKLGLPIVPFCAHDHEGVAKNEHHLKMCRCMGKAPLVKWRDREVTQVSEVTSWKSQFGAFNVGMPLGSISGYVGIDIDGDEGEEIFETLRAGRECPETWEFVSGAGRRIMFQIPKGLKTKKSINTGEGKHTECSILAEGQLTVMPPSIHHTGRRYEWVAGNSPADIDCAMAPDWVIELVREDAPDKQRRKDLRTKLEQQKEAEERRPIISEMFDAFAPMPFSADIPDAILEGKAAQVKSHKEEGPKEKAWSQMLKEQVIEGGRNNSMTKFIGSILAEDFIRRAGKETALAQCLMYNNKCLVPPLEQEEIETTLATLWESEMAKEADFAKKSSEKIPWIPLDILDTVKNRLHNLEISYVYDANVKSLYYCQKQIGPWKIDVDDSKLKKIIMDVLSGDPWCKPAWVTVAKIGEIVNLFKTDLMNTQERQTELFIETGARGDLIDRLPVDGKLLDWRTGIMHPWDSDFLTLANFDVGFDKDATCPYWLQYMEEWLPNAEVRDFLQEFLGNALLPRPDIQGLFVIITGGGANGKSMFLDSIEDVFGGDLCCAQSIARLGERFGATELYGKRLNICSELEDSDGYIANTGMFKKIVTGETLSMEFKGRTSFPYKPVASHIFSCNALPRVKDKSAGWFRRQILVPFEQTFATSGSVAARMRNNIQAERAGIFNWLVEGLKRYVQRGYYQVPGVVKQFSERIKKESDPILQFTSLVVEQPETRCLTHADAGAILRPKYGKVKHGVSPKLLYNMFRMWYAVEISDKNNAVAIKTFDHEICHNLGYAKKAQTNSITKATKNTTYLGMDFTYSEEFCEFVIVLSEAMPRGMEYLDEWVALARICKGYLETGEINPTLVP